jgi:hypothetical protein
MDKVHEFLYNGLDGEVRLKRLATGDAATYDYDWSSGGGNGHPLLDGTEIAESSPEYNKVVVTGGPDGEYSGTAQDSTEITLLGGDPVGGRQRSITDESLALQRDFGYKVLRRPVFKLQVVILPAPGVRHR